MRIALAPATIHRLTFDTFVTLNIPGKRAGSLRLAFKLIWTAHQIFPEKYNQKGLRPEHYLFLKKDIEKKLSDERGQEVRLNLNQKTIEKTLRLMRKAGYLRYVPLEDLWYFSGKAASSLRTLATKIEEYQEPARDKSEADKLIHDLCFGL